MTLPPATPSATEGTGIATPPRATEVEVHGVEPIPDAERSAGPLDLFRLIFGGADKRTLFILTHHSLYTSHVD